VREKKTVAVASAEIRQWSMFVESVLRQFSDLLAPRYKHLLIRCTAGDEIARYF